MLARSAGRAPGRLLKAGAAVLAGVLVLTVAADYRAAIAGYYRSDPEGDAGEIGEKGAGDCDRQYAKCTWRQCER